MDELKKLDKDAIVAEIQNTEDVWEARDAFMRDPTGTTWRHVLEAIVDVAAVNALPELLAKVKRLEEALAIYEKCADDSINHAMFSDKQGVVDGISRAARRARAALNQEGGQ